MQAVIRVQTKVKRGDGT